MKKKTVNTFGSALSRERIYECVVLGKELSKTLEDGYHSAPNWWSFWNNEIPDDIKASTLCIDAVLEAAAMQAVYSYNECQWNIMLLPTDVTMDALSETPIRTRHYIDVYDAYEYFGGYACEGDKLITLDRLTINSKNYWRYFR